MTRLRQLWHRKRPDGSAIQQSIVFDPAPGTGEYRKGFNHPQKGFTQFPSHYTIYFDNVLTFERMELFNCSTVRGPDFVAGGFASDIQHSVVIGGFGDTAEDPFDFAPNSSCSSLRTVDSVLVHR
jgi:hypothetical protein